MKFISTRNKKEIVSSKEAIINGLSRDGGLYVPEKINLIGDLQRLKALDYRALALEIIGAVFDDLDKGNLKKVIDAAYGENFASQDVTPVKKVNGKYFLDLTGGPTSAFKDVALQFLPRVLSMLNDDGKKIVILTATSGDTGKAALEGFKNLDGTAITVLYPHQMVSTIQERQMSTTDGANTKVIAVRGNFDDCQRMVKEILENEAFEDIHLTSANSINIARLVPQIVYYFMAYFDLLNGGEITENEKIDFIVPTGNFGDILAGFLAKRMGLPVNKLVIASNKNNVLTGFVETGCYDANRVLYNTMSPSIDILVSSNLERLLYLLSEDDGLVAGFMKGLKENRKYQVDEKLHGKLQEDFLAFDATETECEEVIRRYFSEFGFLMDPHTSVAVRASEKYETPCKQVILSTASPFKFSKDVYRALTGNEIEDNLSAMDILKEYSGKEIPKNLEKLKELPVIHEKVIEKTDKKVVIDSLRSES